MLDKTASFNKFSNQFIPKLQINKRTVLIYLHWIINIFQLKCCRWWRFVCISTLSRFTFNVPIDVFSNFSFYTIFSKHLTIFLDNLHFLLKSNFWIVLWQFCASFHSFCRQFFSYILWNRVVIEFFFNGKCLCARR